MEDKKFNPTPGPWRIGYILKPWIYTDYPRFNEKGEKFKDFPIATTEESHWGKEAAIDNARLIAAAPTLYHKLKDTVEWLDREIKHHEALAKTLGMQGKGDRIIRLEELRDDLQETLRKVGEG
ncbi:MAG: hypothetical protein WC593_15625 [Methanoregula sp.]